MYPRCTAREIVYVNMLEHDVSVQLSDRPPLSTTWNHRPVRWSCNAFMPFTMRCMMLTSCGRCGWLAGRYSSTSVNAMAYQPLARHHCSGEWLVPGTTHD